MAKREQHEDLQRHVERLGPWFHNIRLPDGTQTCPDHFLGDYPSFKWRAIGSKIPQDLRGWTALDIGCNAGFYSFELARRGAAVTAIDDEPLYLQQARWVASQIGMERSVRFEHKSVYELSQRRTRYDLVLFMGLFYHLRYPLLALDTVSRLVGRAMVFQTLTMPGLAVEPDTREVGFDDRERLARPGWPQMAFIEHRFADDPTNWWAPNHACVEAMLRSTGMQVVERPTEETYYCVPERGNPSSAWSWNEREYLVATGQAAGPDEDASKEEP